MAEVKKATTARCDANIDWNEAKFVEICIGERTEDNPEEGESWRGRDEDAAASSATDPNNDVATWGVLGLRDEVRPALGP